MRKPSLKDDLKDPFKAIENGYVPSFLAVCLVLIKCYFSKEIIDLFMISINNFLDDEVRECLPSLFKMLINSLLIITAPLFFPFWCIFFYLKVRKLVNEQTNK